jgi:hypothetical protein
LFFHHIYSCGGNTKRSKHIKELIMKKTIITALVAVAAFGFSNTSFAGHSSSSAGPGQLGGFNMIDNEFDVDLDISTEMEMDMKTVDVNESVNAATDAPAAGGNIGQVAYDAPAVGGDLIMVSARATAIQLGDVAPVYADLAFMGSGGAIGASGLAEADADADADASSEAAAAAVGGFFGPGASASASAAEAASSAAAAGGTSGDVSLSSITTGAVSTGAVTIDLSNVATALAVGGAYNYNVPTP